MDQNFPVYYTKSLNPRLFSPMLPYNRTVDPVPEMLLPIGCKNKKIYVDLLSKIKFDYPKYPGDEINAVLFITSVINGFIYRVAINELNLTSDRVAGLRSVIEILELLVGDECTTSEWTTVTNKKTLNGKRYVNKMINKLYKGDMGDVFDPIYQFLPLMFVNHTLLDWYSDLSRKFMAEFEKRTKHHLKKNNGEMLNWGTKQNMVNIYIKLFKELHI